MSNPYRGRPTRSRVDPTIAGYGINQTPWNPGANQRPPNIDSNPSFQASPPAPLANQIQTQDSWDWPADNGNNGNDVWNWNIDQAETQQKNQLQKPQQHYPQPQHQPPQLPKQNQFNPVYSNKKQSIMPLSGQENYYKNLNGNDSRGGIINQHNPSGRETPRSAQPVREPTPKQPDSFPQFNNYSHNQQFSTPPQTNSNSALHSGSIEQSQWPREVHCQSLPFSSSQINNQKQQIHQTPPPQASMNNYNSGSTDQQSVPFNNWQNHTENPTATFWHESSSTKSEQPTNNINNSYSQPIQQALHQPQQRIPNAFPPSNVINSDQSKIYNPHESLQENSIHTHNWPPQNIPTSNHQWPNHNSENVANVLPRQQSLPSNNTWPAEDANSSQIWQQVGTGNIPNSQWRQPKLQPGGSLEESALSENNKGDWQPVHALPSHFNSSTTSTTSGSLANMSSSTEQLEDRKRSLTPTTSFTSLNEFHSQVPNYSQNNAETNPISNVESFNSQNNVDLDLGLEAEWNPMSSSINSVSHDLKYQHVENMPYKEEISAQAAGDWSNQSASNLTSQNIENKSGIAPINAMVDQKSAENLSISSHEQFDKQQNNSVSLENAPQDNCDQRYKQNIHSQSDKDFFGSNSEKQWSIEPNVENYENVQQQTEFVNLEVVTPESQEKDLYGSRESINKETLDNDQSVRQVVPLKENSFRDFRQEISNVEVLSVQHIQQPIPTEQAPDNYEFASNDRNTFLETGELTDPHSQEPESIPPSQDEENDEVPNDIPFLREVPGQSSSIDPRRNDPTGQEQYAQGVVGTMAPRMSDPRRNDPSGQEQQQNVVQNRSGIQTDRSVDRRDVPTGQERTTPVQTQQQQARSSDLENVERRNDPPGRERSLPPPQQSRNEPSGEEQPVISLITQTNQLESSVVREIPGRGNEPEETISQSDSGLRQIPGGASSNESVQNVPDDRATAGARVVTGSQVTRISSLGATQDSTSDTRNKREEAVGAPIAETQAGSGPPNRRDSYEDGDDEGSGNSREGSRDRRRDISPKSRQPRYDYNRKTPYYDRDRDYEEDYYFDRRRPTDFERNFDPREEIGGRNYSNSFREEDRRNTSHDDLDRDRDRDRERDRHSRNDLDRRSRLKDEFDDRDGRRRADNNRRDKSSDPRHLDRENREFDPRYRGERDFGGRDRRVENGRSRNYSEYDSRDPRDNYRREYYDDSYSRNSRPSSRSSYNDRDRDYYTRPRDMYSSYGYNNYPSYDYGPNYNRDYYAYLENLRRTDPAAYTEWYHKYMQHQQQISRVSSNYPEDKASVHSGRSSCDDRNSSDKRNLTDVSLLEDQTVASSRLTPTKFSTAHTKGIFSIGALLHVHAAYPADGERARVDVLKLDQLLQHDAMLRELRSYPGPLIKGVTHKKTIIDYCENKIKKASSNDEIVEVSSYILLYELMIMLIQQNGNVVGVDIASLLLRNKDAYPYEATKPVRENNRRESTVSQRSSASGGDKSATEISQTCVKEEQVKPQKTIEELTNEFRNTLLYGLVQEALEFAMVEGLWGHALFLASKLDKRTHASVMTRFANSLPPQDPLQTLYQLHSGRVPASVTCVSDARWDDWRPHLAMIISNTSANPEINRRSISNLGDTLAARGDIYAAHFCYILSQVDFGTYGASNVKLVLIGANHHKPYSEFISTEAILLTEIYEYARKLSEPFTLTELQTFKFNMALKMVDYGLIEKALLYIEQVAVNIVGEPEKYKKSFISDVYVLGDKLKYHDPVCKDSEDDVANLPWLKNLADIVGQCENGEIVEQSNISQVAESNLETADALQQQQQQQQHKWNAPQSDYSTDNVTSMMGNLDINPQRNWQQKSTATAPGGSYSISSEREVQYSNETVSETQSQYPSYQQDYWSMQQQQLQQQQQQQQSFDQKDYSSDFSQSEWPNSTKLQYTSEQQEVDQSEVPNKWTYEQQHHSQQQQPNISMGPSGGKQYDPLEELESLEPSRLGAAGKSTAEAKKQAEKSAVKKSPNSSGGGGWFGGLISKLVPQPKNQMILPDDSNPSIVWDPVTEKWLNKDDEDGGNSAPLAPPPKMSEIPGFKPTPTPVAVPPTSTLPPSLIAPTPTVSVTAGLSVADETMNSSKMITGGGNMYKLSRSRNMRANYVDVMNPGGTKNNSSITPVAPVLAVPTPVGSPAMPMAASSPQLFIPAPVNDPNAPLDFLTPVSAAAPQTNENSQALSRWSSTSSLSREVQSYTMRDPRLLQRDKGPMMYNPMDMKDRSSKNQARSRYPPR